MMAITFPKIRWKTIRTIYFCRTFALFVGGATPTVGVEATMAAHKPPPEGVVVVATLSR